MIKYRKPAILLISLLCILVLPIGAEVAVDEIDFYSERNAEPKALPCNESITFSHKANATGHDVLDSRMFRFRAEPDGIVSILFSSASPAEQESSVYNLLSASVYSDTGVKICEA